MIVPSPPRSGLPGRGLSRPGRGTGLLLGGALDAVLGDPRRAHPVAAFGAAAMRAEARLWSDSRIRGAGLLAA
ncbi:MAG: cobD, partial [Actinomycetia bacterium]|nr:cobD [Actinomycetes bacterium]